MKTKYLLVLPLATLLFSLFTQPVYAADVNVTVNPSQKTVTIPQDFLGLSVEPGGICGLIAGDRQTPVLAQLFTNLSPAVLRLGGGTVERMIWKPNDPCGGTTISKAGVNGIIRLMKKVDWKVIWGIALRNNTADSAKDEAKYVVSRAGSTLSSLELGNEPDAHYSYTEYKSRWISFYNAIRGQTPSAPFSGPSIAGGRSFYDQFLDEQHAKINLATRHRYPIGKYIPGDFTQATANSMLARMKSNAFMKDLIDFFDPYISKARSHGLSLRINETNSIGHGGAPGISDTFASALWAADYMFNLLEHRVAGVNFHGNPMANPTIGTSSEYSPINNSSTVAGTYTLYARPIYYALLLFKYAAPNGKVTPVTLSTSLNVAAHAVVNTNGKLRVILINKENRSVSVAINTTGSYGSANLIRLTAPSLTTTITSPRNSAVKLGGKSVSVDGTWSPGTPEQISVNGASSNVVLPSYSAAVITYSSQIPPPTPIPGDLNGDGKVDSSDYTIFVPNFGKTGTAGWIKSDINNDGKVDIFDFNILVGNYGK